MQLRQTMLSKKEKGKEVKFIGKVLQSVQNVKPNPDLCGGTPKLESVFPFSLARATCKATRIKVLH